MAPCNGYCYRACPPGEEFAADCTCVPSCPAGLTDCGGHCLDTTSDPANCGDCGRTCPAPTNICQAAATCIGGVCGYEPATGDTRCRAASDVCDTPEFCTGSATACPDDVFADLTVECRAASCANGVATRQATCTGTSATCPPAVTETCAPYRCNAEATDCRDVCATDDECAPGAHCDAPDCLPDAGNGEACDEESDCRSGFCVGAVCCGQDCPAPEHGAATCADGMTCGFACDSGFASCGDGCCADDRVCCAGVCCAAGLACRSDGTCGTSCGGEGEVCCARNFCDAGLECDFNNDVCVEA